MSSSAARTRADWINAAIELGAHTGFHRLAVEPLARHMGTTKGSFYWHFDGLADLLTAVAQHWEQAATVDIIAALNDMPPVEQAQALLNTAFAPSGFETAEYKLILATDHPHFGPVITAVHTRRMEFLHQLALQGRACPTAAATKARMAYACYLGHLQLHACGLEAEPTALPGMVQELVDILLS